jgi:hypothetical protein
MPGSSEKGKPTIAKWFKDIPGKRLILDVGPAWGTYSRLLREERQIWHAVEIHKPYVRRFKLERLYDKVFVEDVRRFVPSNKYDVAILGDVLEHMKNDEAVAVLGTLLRYSRYVIVSLPLDLETGAGPGTGDVDWNNPYEVHLGKWSHQLFVDAAKNLGASIFAMEKFDEIAVWLLGLPDLERENATLNHGPDGI